MPLTAEQQLIRFYRTAAEQLRRQLRDDIMSGRVGSAVYRRRQLAAVRRELAALGQRTRLSPVEIIATGYDKGALIVDRIAGKQAQAAYAFTGAHRQSAQVLAENLTSRLDGARDLVGRRVEDAYRDAALEVIGADVASGSTRRETSRRLADKLARQGITGFVDKRGAQWQLDTYVEMVARTTTREAMSVGTDRRMRETGQQLITISAHATDTEICKPYEGKTFALPGIEVPGYDTIDTLPPFHPRCLHVATPAAENLDSLLRELGVSAETGSG